MSLNPFEGAEVAEILKLRANEVAAFSDEHRKSAPAAVDMALSREIQRLRRLAQALDILRPAPQADPSEPSDESDSLPADPPFNPEMVTKRWSVKQRGWRNPDPPTS